MGERAKVRLHVQNHPGQLPVFQATEAVWNAAAAQFPNLAERLDVTIGWTEDDFSAAMASAEILVTWTAVLRERFPTVAPRLRMIFVTSSGLDPIAPFDWLPPGCILVNNKGTHGAKAGEWGLMAILMLANDMPRHVTNQRDRRWDKTFSSVVNGQTLVALGVGNLAGPTLRHARAFGMHVVGVRRTAAAHPDCDEVVAVAELGDVLPRADYLLIACPLTDATRGIVSRERLGRMKPTAGVINMARGGIIDQDALCDLLDDGRLAGAVLDVVTPEPLPPDSRVWTTRNLILSPHVSADDPATYIPRSLEIFFENLRHWFDGTPLPNRVDTARGY